MNTKNARKALIAVAVSLAVAAIAGCSQSTPGGSAAPTVKASLPQTLTPQAASQAQAQEIAEASSRAAHGPH